MKTNKKLIAKQLIQIAKLLLASDDDLNQKIKKLKFNGEDYIKFARVENGYVYITLMDHVTAIGKTQAYIANKIGVPIEKVLIDYKDFVEELSPELKNQFYRLVMSLEPEILYCDGECTRAEAKRKEAQIMKEWAKLEEKAGRKVSKDEAWKK